MIVYVIINHHYRRRKRLHVTMTSKEAIKMLLSFTGILCLLGLTWIFAVFTFTSSNDIVYYVFQLLFTVLNASQGFFIFLFFVVLSSEARDAWKTLCEIINNDRSTLSIINFSKERVNRSKIEELPAKLKDEHISKINPIYDEYSFVDNQTKIELSEKPLVQLQPVKHNYNIYHVTKPQR